MCDATDSTDSSDSGDFAPGPAVTELRLSHELSGAWVVDADLRERTCAAVRQIVRASGDAVRIVNASGRELVMVYA